MATLHPAHPLPAKIEHWDALHLTFRHVGLPHLPTIHDVAIRNVLSSAAYDRPIAPSRYSIKTLAWMGDGVLYLAATKACLKAGLSQPYQGCEDLGRVRTGLTTNRTFSYLTLSYRIHEILGESLLHSNYSQKRHADFFEAYIGAAWESARLTKDPEHVHEIEYFLSQLYKPKVWPALESLMNGSKNLVTAVHVDQELTKGSESDDDYVAVFDVPPVRPARHKYGKIASGSAPKSQRKTTLKAELRATKLADIAARNRQTVIAARVKNKPIKALPHRQAAQTTPHRPREVSYWSARRRQIEEWSASRRGPSSGSIQRTSRPTIDARPAAPCTPVRSKDTIPRSLSRRPPPSTIKVYRLAAGNVGEEEIDMDICEDSDWEDVKPVAGPSTSTIRVTGHRKQDGSGTSLAPIVID